MSEQGSRRPVLFTVAGVTLTVALILAYRQYSHGSTSTTSSLHRSNAVRRSRRRWRRGFAPREIDYDPISRAIDNLKKRIEEGRPYGRYNNQLLFTIEEEHLERGMFDLLPGNLAQMHTILSQVRTMSEEEQDKLRLHIESIFVQNFLSEEFPPGYVIGEDIGNLVASLAEYGVDEDCVHVIVHQMDHGKPLLSENEDLRDEPDTSTAVEPTSTQQAIEALGGQQHGDSSDDSDADEDDSDPGGSQNMLDLLYHIASEQARREGFIHRNVECNSCGVKPIQGIRYHCANCYDYDLCEDCEALQVHNRSHVFFKVRIPAPSRGRFKQPIPVWYPGQPNALPSTMPRELQKSLLDVTSMDKTEMEACYEQFKCLAGEQLPIETDPAHMGMAISRQNFDMFFTPSSADRPPTPNLIYDRIFAFYDTHDDGLITLDEYIIGIATILERTRGARLSRMFHGHDLDRDGYVDRKDFLRMFRAYYALQKELNREMASLQEDLDDDIRDVVQGSQPISAAFGDHFFIGHASRMGQDKEPDNNGDLSIMRGPNGVLQNDSEMQGDRVRAIGNAAVRDRTQTHPFRSFRPRSEPDSPLLIPAYPRAFIEETDVPVAEDIDDEEMLGPDPTLHVYGWPPQQTPEAEDIINALGVDMPIEDVTDPVDQSRVIYAQSQRLDEESNKILSEQRTTAVQELWRRRQFYLDEEEGLTKPPGYREPDSSEDEAASVDEPREAPVLPPTLSRRQSLRSRSSSKVRFDDTAIDTDHETRSNTSSRSIPVNERWGGFELSGPERDVGREILYQAVQRGLNELLDPLFKKKEDEAMEAISTRTLRSKWAKELGAYAASVKRKAEEKAEALRQADLLRTQALFSNGVDQAPEAVPDAPQKEPSSPVAKHADTDHVQIMFGNSPAKPQQTIQKTEPIRESTISESPDTTPDPTLPQNKPNDTSFVIKLEPLRDRKILDNSGYPPLRPSDVESTPSVNVPSETTLSTWLIHLRIDEEARKRGGYGKLSYREFCRLMIREAHRHEGIDIIGGEGSSSRRARGRHVAGDSSGRSDDIFEDDEDGLAEFWSSTGNLGRMDFLGSWLEMAQF